MNRAKIRKAVAALPPFLEGPRLEKAMRLVGNDRTRQRIRSAYQRSEGRAARRARR